MITPLEVILRSEGVSTNKDNTNFRMLKQMNQ
jgi:hypothetical protein